MNRKLTGLPTQSCACRLRNPDNWPVLFRPVTAEDSENVRSAKQKNSAACSANAQNAMKKNMLLSAKKPAHGEPLLCLVVHDVLRSPGDSLDAHTRAAIHRARGLRGSARTKGFVKSVNRCPVFLTTPGSSRYARKRGSSLRMRHPQRTGHSQQCCGRPHLAGILVGDL